MMRGLADLRYEPTGKRVRALAGAHTLTDSRRAQRDQDDVCVQG